ncbi:MAG: TM0106 family RecB-like putative nuclease [Microbacterium ginsengisoli]|uniref:TM0106 family RecB-like putative nuclease n=1 Tax=Microbacterium TaxID=33882 RepID=UPI000700DCE5|nr:MULTISPECIES: bifunctional RecB family nuclease/DEAD/DEAH box helicase [unclassified Microbacterium]KQR93961.1 DNA helicase [Microbacterium sp. Leaf347]KQR97169.1 DNA helicase [Microbacterium sp. Leaf351]MBN9198402.1 TM0106 family RecB-like putative nuclease [Microbacterium ginsengisoli]OJU78185.1 MAG: DNA helicase [Microbacterium sp. 71-23]
MRYIEAAGPQPARIVWSASDFKAAAECEFAWLRAIDAKLGRVPAVDEPDDPTLERAGRLGTQHELRVLERYRETHPGTVVEIPETRSADATAMDAAVTATVRALGDPAASVVYQAAFATGEFVGFADFLLRGDDGRWIVQDTKLARHARVTALMQLAAYVDQLDRLGIARADEVELLLGDGTTSVHRVADLMPVFTLRRERLRALIADRDLAAGASGTPIAWGDDRGALHVVACGRCATCDLEVVGQRDLLLVAGMRPVQRERMRAGGVDTIDALAAASAPPEGLGAEVWESLRTQARLQLASERQQTDAASRPPAPAYEVVSAAALGALPRPDHGDLFFDFEGDPLYTEHTGGANVWGIDYLFGWVDTREQYSALWAHTFADEKRALEQFVDLIELRRRTHSGLHIYHYAPYEPTHLLQMAARHGTREAEVDRLLREGVFVDLYPIVRRALRVGSRSYSIKKLEPLYMGDDLRTSDVQRGDDSIVRYVEARAAADDGDDAAAAAILDDLAEYNRDDCVSTLRLRDWLVARARDAGLYPARDVTPEETPYEPSPTSVALSRRATDATALTSPDDPDVRALALAAAAIDYYPREAKTFWAGHFLRLREPVSLWEQTRDVVVVDAARSRVVTDWHRGDGQRVDRRIIELHGDVAPGTRLSEGSDPFALYPMPAPYPIAQPSPRWIHAGRTVQVLEVLDDGAVIAEFAVDGETWDTLPIALTPPRPPQAAGQQTAIDAWAEGLLDAAPGFPDDPATDLLRRRPPRLRGRQLTSSPHGRAAGELAATIAASVADLDRSYLAVQGPPGTGKTYVGARVIASLVRDRGFRVGVVAQSHAVVEHMLEGVIAAGVPAVQVAKAPKDPASTGHAFTAIRKNGMAGFIADQPGGFVVGGTAWDFANTNRVARGGLDLLVIDEAGQFSLASTIAVSLAAPRLLLLGDPQQLPQVSQGTHPEPVDTSALGWVMADAAVLPPTHGYFLSRTWRMHPRVAAPVSTLSYDGALASAPDAGLRSLAGIEPGLHPLPLAHEGNAVQSPEEAAEVVRLARDLVGRTYTDPGDPDAAGGRALAASDLIVVTPYNAQQVLVEEALAGAGLADVRVGTVDRFQGQEAAVAIVSLAASSGRAAPRGLEFLLLQNRLNVAVSRAKVAAYVIYSPALLDDLPYTPAGVARLSAFARLVGVA